MASRFADACFPLAQQLRHPRYGKLNRLLRGPLVHEYPLLRPEFDSLGRWPLVDKGRDNADRRARVLPRSQAAERADRARLNAHGAHRSSLRIARDGISRSPPHLGCVSHQLAHAQWKAQRQGRASDDRESPSGLVVFQDQVPDREDGEVHRVGQRPTAEHVWHENLGPEGGFVH